MRRFRTLRRKQDTPLKSRLSRRIGLKRPIKDFETLLEDEEVGPSNVTPVKPSQPLPERDSENDIRAESSESGTTPSLVRDTSSYSSGDDESSLLDSSSSLPSPEVFREDLSEQSTFPLDDLTDLHLPIKNSTVLDLSHAEAIFMHPSPNMSTIMDGPTVLSENSPLKIDTRPSDGCNVVEDLSLKNEKYKSKATQTTPSFVKKGILFKKRVWFRSPLFSEKSRAESITAPKPRGDRMSKQVTPSIPHKPIRPTAKTSKEDTTKVDKGIFFDFPSAAEQDSFFQKMRERCARLKNTALFPL